MLLKGCPFSAKTTDFTLDELASQFGTLKLPKKSQRRKQGKTTATGCSFIVADQEGELVMNARPSAWDPSGYTFASLAAAISGGSGQYLSTRSGKGTCRREANGIVYEGPPGEDVDEDVLIKALVPQVHFPSLLPHDVGFQTVFWMGAKGNNFGLHTDLFSEQFLVQYQGVKEVVLLLPRDASKVAPFPYLSSPIWYKSERRSVVNLDSTCITDECLRATLHPGDVLYIPLWWWHEVKTVSPGPSVSVTFRFHTEDAERFAKIMDAMYWLNHNAQKESTGRLAQHLRSYIAYGIAKEGTEALAQTHTIYGRPCGSPLHTMVAMGLAGACIGFVFGRFSR